VIVEGQARGVAAAPARPRTTHAAVTYSASWAFALFAVDLSMFAVSAYAAHLIAQHYWRMPPPAMIVAGDLIVVGMWVLMFRLLGLYTRTYAFRMKDELYYTIAALSLGVMPQLIVFTIVPAISTSRMGAIFFLAASFVFVGAGRTVMHGVRNLRIFQRNHRIAVIGTGSRVHEALASLDVDAASSAIVMEVDDIDATLSQGALGDQTPDRIAWFSRAIESRCNTLVFTEMVDPRFLPSILDVAARYHMRVAFAPPRIKRYSFSLALETSGSQALIVARQLNACTPTARLKKRLLDVGLGVCATILFSPLMLLCAIAVYVDSGFPIIYRQERIGMHGKRFDILKFRSMRLDAENESGAVWVRENDDRRTRVGAILRTLSFDELPQLVNVLAGDMSLVGPRPERPVFVEKFRRLLPRYDERHLVPPGITGWSHIHMRRLVREDDIAERLDYDLRYVEQWTVWMDVSILLKTAVEFLFHRPG
jgi:exopolysaccharide biosynthesis polyprenyl glycosylphosphotransferase